jgi:hypothetical protein
LESYSASSSISDLFILYVVILLILLEVIFLVRPTLDFYLLSFSLSALIYEASPFSIVPEFLELLAVDLVSLDESAKPLTGLEMLGSFFLGT